MQLIWFKLCLTVLCIFILLYFFSFVKLFSSSFFDKSTSKYCNCKIWLTIFFWNYIILSEISNLENTISTISNIVSKNTIENNNTSSESTNNAFKEIILNGNYAIENSDAGYEFTSSGKVTVISNLETNEGTYITSGENEITIHFTNRTSYDIDTSKKETSSIDEEEILKYVDENTLIITKLSNGKNANTKLIKNK